MLQIVVNGTSRLVEAGQTILAALREIGIHVPALCHDPRLEPMGGCRLCLVQIKGQPRPCTACTTCVTEGMELSTHTEELESLRRTQLRLLARQYPSAADPSNSPNQFLKWIRHYQLENELQGALDVEHVDESHPLIHVDMSRCIHCFRCVRICEEVAGRFVWKAWNRGDRTEIRPAGRTSLRDSECVSCGACVDTCPSGALRDKSTLYAPPPSAQVRSVCPYCGTGCEIQVNVRDNAIESVLPILDAPVNKGHLCVKGRYGWNFVDASDRITQPLIRDGKSWREVSWSEATGFFARRLQSIVEQFGPNSVGVLGSARATNEENYLTQKFARVVLGTNNVDCCARVCHAPTAAGMKIMLGTGAATNSFDDIELARTILVCGANPRENHPIVGDRILQAARRGANLIVIDPRRVELAQHAQIHLPLRPGTNIPLLNALANVIVDEHLFEPSAPERFEKWDAFCRFIADFSPAAVSEVCGVDAALIVQAARQYATQSPAMCIHGLGVTEHRQGTEGVMCLVNLALLTGNIGRPGGGINPLRGQNNVQGAAHMGCDPGILTGSAALRENLERFDVAWNAHLPRTPGLNLMQMMDAAADGKLKAMWCIGYDVALTNANAESTLAAFDSLDLVVVQDLFLNETARRFGHLFLPACSSLEKDGTFMNSERRIQRVRAALQPRGASRPDWQIICQIAQEMGHADQFSYESAREIWDEIRSVWPDGAGISYDRLESGGLQWPCPTVDHAGTTILHTEIVNQGSGLRLRETKFLPTDEQVSAEFPFLLTTGRGLYQFNAGTMTGRSSPGQFHPRDLLHVSPVDAQKLGINEGEAVCVSSRYGEISLAARISADVQPGQLFATFQTPELLVNQLTSRFRDRFVQTPEYKVTAVQISSANGTVSSKRQGS